jgi:hypothetical protein
MRRALLTAAIVLACGAAFGADAIAPHLTGAWGTSPSLFEGDSPRGETQLHLAADGLGAMAGSTGSVVAWRRIAIARRAVPCR